MDTIWANSVIVKELWREEVWNHIIAMKLYNLLVQREIVCSVHMRPFVEMRTHSMWTVEKVVAEIVLYGSTCNFEGLTVGSGLNALWFYLFQ